MWLCKCDCGNEIEAASHDLRKSHTQSCGCLQKQRASESSRTHGMSRSLEHRIWSGMKTRCYNAKHQSYNGYGSRGIKVCERWHDFSNFLADIGTAPSPSHTIERIDVNGDYEPSNCRWLHKSDQAKNTRRSIKLTMDGITKGPEEWAPLVGISAWAIRERVKHGWPDHEALTVPARYKRHNDRPWNKT